jgi:transaldolase
MTPAKRTKTKILVDGDDPAETSRIKELIGYVDGQTTNPSLIEKTRDREGFSPSWTELQLQGKTSDGRPLKALPYRSLNLDQSWENLDLTHELTTKGIQEFVEDYQSTLKKIASGPKHRAPDIARSGCPGDPASSLPLLRL